MNKRWKIAQAAEIKWWTSYLKDKDPAMYLEKKRQYWWRILTELDFPLVEGEQILDAGCGPAGIFLILQDQYVDAIDPLLPKYEIQIPYFVKNKFPWVTFYTLALEQLTSKQSYDKIFCLNVINHVANLHLSIRQLIQATKSGGDLLITVDAHNYTFLKKIFQIFPGDILHPHQYSLLEYQKFLHHQSCFIHKTQNLKNGYIFDYWAIWIKKQ